MTEEELQSRVVYNIKHLRKNAHLSQEKLADKADISRQMMNDIEGKRSFLSKTTLVKIANALGVDVHELFLPSRTESEKAKTTYDYALQEITEKIRAVLNTTLDDIQKQ